jgi:8-oxo-dGTP diphosphatase
MEVQTGIKRTAAMVILRHGTSFLLLKRNKSPNIGRYVPVGGKIDPHERPFATALRETYEEAGVQLKPEQVRYAGVLSESSPTDYNWICFIYQAEVEPFPPPPCDEGTLEWVDLGNIPDLPTPPTDWQIYQYVLKSQPFALDAQYDEHLQLVEMREEISGQRVYSLP